MKKVYSIPKIHQAVIDGDNECIKKIKDDEAFKKSLDRRGRTALQLAHFLNEKKAALLLQERDPKKIKIELQDGEKRILFAQELEALFGFSYATSLKFNSLQQLESVSNDLKAAGKKFDLEIDSGYVCDCVIKWRSREVGYGLYAGVDLLPGSYVGEYTGKVRRISRFNANLNGYCFHYPTRFFSWHYTVIDSEKCGNETRFINHSENPNLELVWAVKNDLLHLLFFTKGLIEKGKELTFDYGPDYWRHRQKENFG